MFDLETQLNGAVRRVALASRFIADEWVRGVDITRQQAFALGYIAKNQDNGVIARDLAEVSNTTPASVASLIKGLEQRGLVERRQDPDDSRIKLLRATPAGVDIVSGFEQAMIDANRAVFAVLAPEERQTLLSLLTRVIDANPGAAPPR